MIIYHIGESRVQLGESRVQPGVLWAELIDTRLKLIDLCDEPGFLVFESPDSILRHGVQAGRREILVVLILGHAFEKIDQGSSPLFQSSF